MGDRAIDWAYSGICLFAAASFGLLLGDGWTFIIGFFAFLGGGFFERAWNTRSEAAAVGGR